MTKPKMVTWYRVDIYMHSPSPSGPDGKTDTK